MAYLALYRAWRPQTFKEVIGQEHITRTLKNALKENRFSHAYLFSGPRGTGKTSAAKIFAKAVNCELGPSEEPCNQCHVCKGITEGTVLDVVEIDAASNRGVEEIRDLRENVKFAPTEARFKVYIIDEVHMLTTEAFNALLKTLEEPPKHVIFILATTEPYKLPLTIISRCQRFDFRRISTDVMIKRLDQIVKSEGFIIEEKALSYIASHSEGGMRDALSLLDQVLSFSGDKVTFEDVLRITGRAPYQVFSEVAKAVKEQNTAQVLEIVSQLLQDGMESEKILEDLLYYYRDLLLFNSAPELQEIKEKLALDPELSTIAEIYSEEELYLVIELLNKYLNEVRNINQTRIVLELAIVKVVNSLTKDKNQQFASSEVVIELKKKIRELETKIEQLTYKEVKLQNIDNKQSVSSKVISANQVSTRLRKISSGFSKEKHQRLLKMWPNILKIIKQKKVTVHAWLIDGEPVGVTDDLIVIAFNNVMHRDTTNKPANRQLIEEVIYEQTGEKYHIFNVMQKDWKDFNSEKPKSSSKEKREINNAKEDDDFVAKAIELFGEDLVVIKD
ncbi:hypothetical protein BHF71_08125 [Vulcanibacillus modesticaldus]|uniref:DNA-directed DNA polymerase n=1 Tax=Vulcanibacillus modesticaldus TaxID=337097 RepID=A0A1D2YVF9_9BACI|nr:DNA polymerase III subunit gamma/tau [Vulcanibacillus modesticaldus]OEF99643.1 hypothetical protein BHF71_08125 [Vulcanibacillus modesticaldus]